MKVTYEFQFDKGSLVRAVRDDLERPFLEQAEKAEAEGKKDPSISELDKQTAKVIDCINKWVNGEDTVRIEFDTETGQANVCLQGLPKPLVDPRFSFQRDETGTVDIIDAAALVVTGHRSYAVVSHVGFDEEHPFWMDILPSDLNACSFYVIIFKREYLLYMEGASNLVFDSLELVSLNRVLEHLTPGLAKPLWKPLPDIDGGRSMGETQGQPPRENSIVWVKDFEVTLNDVGETWKSEIVPRTVAKSKYRLINSVLPAFDAIVVLVMGHYPYFAVVDHAGFDQLPEDLDVEEIVNGMLVRNELCFPFVYVLFDLKKGTCGSFIDDWNVRPCLALKLSTAKMMKHMDVNDEWSLWEEVSP